VTGTDAILKAAADIGYEASLVEPSG